MKPWVTSFLRKKSLSSVRKMAHFSIWNRNRRLHSFVQKASRLSFWLFFGFSSAFCILPNHGAQAQEIILPKPPPPAPPECQDWTPITPNTGGSWRGSQVFASQIFNSNMPDLIKRYERSTGTQSLSNTVKTASSAGQAKASVGGLTFNSGVDIFKSRGFVEIKSSLGHLGQFYSPTEIKTGLYFGHYAAEYFEMDRHVSLSCGFKW